MDWAEQGGLGELALTPEQFWVLTPREFMIKWEAFTRDQDRGRALALELAMHSGRHDEKQLLKMQRAVNGLRRYPIKPWLLSDPPA